MKVIHVAVGVVLNQNKQVLIAKRPDHVHQGGLWEFPGGKVESNESVFEALVREFKEEVDLKIESAEAFMTIKHDYTDKQVLLDVWLSKDFVGEPRGLEGQELKWLAIKELEQYSFPDANKIIIEKLLEYQ